MSNKRLLLAHTWPKPLARDNCWYEQLTELVEMGLHKNLIEKIEDNSFIQLNKLKNLKLQSNRILII